MTDLVLEFLAPACEFASFLVLYSSIRRAKVLEVEDVAVETLTGLAVGRVVSFLVFPYWLVHGFEGCSVCGSVRWYGRHALQATSACLSVICAVIVARRSDRARWSPAVFGVAAALAALVALLSCGGSKE